jgi:hypothetical protein
MMFAKPLRERVRSGRIRCSVRIWLNARVKAGGRYRMDDGHIVVDSIKQIGLADVTHDLARESGFESVDALLGIARHGAGEKVFLIRFHYLPPGGWDVVKKGVPNRVISRNKKTH